MQTLQEELNKIKTDNLTGSKGLHDRLLLSIESSLENDKDSWMNRKNDIIRSLEELAGNLNQFVILKNFIGEFTRELNHWNEDRIIEQIRTYLDHYKKKWDKAQELAIGHFLDRCELEGNVILLHSNSSSIRSLFRTTRNKDINLKIVQTESRPGFEGRKQAMYLADIGYKAKIIVDAAIMLYLDQIDMVILGADALYPEQFVNKIGSHTICSAAHETGKPVYVLADSRKISKHSDIPRENPKPVMEVWKEHPEELEIENYYFETVPNKLVTGFVTESGIMTR